MPAVMLTVLKTDKFKTGYLSLNMLTQLTRENASMTSLVPKVLARGTKSLPDIGAINARLCELYGTRIVPTTHKFGEIHSVGFDCGFIDDKFAPGGEPILEQVVALLGEMLLEPETRGGLLLPDYVDSEKEKMLDSIRGRVNEKISYSILRLLEQMCCYEDYAVPLYGFEAEAENINYRKLTRRYKDLLAQSPIEIIYCGSADAKRVERALRDALLNLPRGEIDYDIGTDVRLNSVEEQPRIFTEELDVTQGKLAIGFRLGDSMEEPDLAAMRVFNAVYGGSVSSKLFMNVREKLSLAYFASSSLDTTKGIMAVYSGIEFDKYDEALGEILAQLDAVKNGDVTDDEMANAISELAANLRMISDDQADLVQYWLQDNIEGLECSPEEMASLVEMVTKQDVINIAKNVECDAIYFLCGEESDDGE
jgi:predicted Zn-dependent peptidase